MPLRAEYTADELNDWISVDEFGKRHTTHPSTVRRMIDAGELDAYRMTSRGHYRIPRAAETHWIRNCVIRVDAAS